MPRNELYDSRESVTISQNIELSNPYIINNNNITIPMCHYSQLSVVILKHSLCIRHDEENDKHCQVQVNFCLMNSFE